MIHHHLFGGAHIDRIGRTTGPAALGQSNPGSMRETPGGAAFNVASSLAAFGAPVTLFSAIGADHAGDEVSAEAATRGIKFIDFVSEPERPTATYTAILDANGELIAALSDMQIYAGVQLEQATRSVDHWLHADTNFPEPILDTLFNRPAAYRSATTVSAAKAGRLRRHLLKLDILFTNRAEAAALCQAPSETPLADLAAQLSEKGCRNAVLSDGPRPICVLDSGEIAEIPVPACDVKSVTGAGDALAAATLFALGKGRPLKEAIPFGIRAAQAILTVDSPYRADLAQATGAL